MRPRTTSSMRSSPKSTTTRTTRSPPEPREGDDADGLDPTRANGLLPRGGGHRVRLGGGRHCEKRLSQNRPRYERSIPSRYSECCRAILCREAEGCLYRCMATLLRSDLNRDRID